MLLLLSLSTQWLPPPLLDFPDGDLAISACRATEDVSVLSRAKCLDAV